MKWLLMKLKFRKQWRIFNTETEPKGYFPRVEFTEKNGWNVVDFPAFNERVWQYAKERGWVKIGLFGRVRKQRF